MIFARLMFLLIMLASHSAIANENPKHPSIYNESCGLKGTVNERIQDCARLSSSQKGVFVLVTRTEKTEPRWLYLSDKRIFSGLKFEVYMDLSTGLLWSDLFADNTPYIELDGRYRQSSYCREHAKSIMKGHLTIDDNVIWGTPGLDDWKVAKQNGLTEAFTRKHTRNHVDKTSRCIGKH